MIQQFINRLFRFETIDRNGATERYLRRWTLLRLRGGRAVYLHHFVGSDWSGDLHDHPKSFLSVGLWGSYIEECHGRLGWWSDRRGQIVRRRWRAPWVRRFRATHAHRLLLPEGGNCWTLVYVGPLQRDWGFYTATGWMRWDEYVRAYGGKGRQ